MDESHIEPPPIVAPPIAPQEPGTVAVALDQDGRLAEDVACRHCGYNLRGLALDGQCPECEMAIEKTLHGFLLRFSDPTWLKRLRSGLTLLIVAILIGIVLAIAWIAGIVFWPSMIDPSPIVAGAIVLIPTAGLTIMQLVGYIFVTTAEPGSASNGAVWSARRLARIGLISSAVLGLVEVIIDQDTYTGFVMEFGENEWLYGLAWILGLLSVAAGFIGLFALFVYGRSLALRFPADSLAKSTRIVMWGYTIPAAAAAIVQLVAEAYYSTSTSLGGFEKALMVSQVVFGIPVLVFGIWGIVLLFMYRSQFTKVRKLATT